MKRFFSSDGNMTQYLFLLSVLIPQFASADGVVVSRETAEKLRHVGMISEATSTKIIIPDATLREAFGKLFDGEQVKIPVGKGDSVVISRSGNNLEVVAIADNIGTTVNIDKKITNYVDLKTRGSIVIDRSYNSLFVNVIAGNVGSVINVDLSIDNRISPGVKRATPRRTTARPQRARQVESDDEGNDENEPSVEPSAPPVQAQAPAPVYRALSGYSYHCQAGQTFQFSRGYSWWNGREWMVGARSAVLVSFDRYYLVHAH